MNRPQLNSNQYAVGQAEFLTGHILKIDKTIYGQQGDVFLVFDSQEAAIEYCERTVKECPTIECWIEDSLGNHLMTIDTKGKRKQNKS
jgi:hypothetical protein